MRPQRRSAVPEPGGLEPDVVVEGVDREVAPEPRLPEAAERVLSPSASTVFTETVPPTSQQMYRAGAETTAQGASGQVLSGRTGRQVEQLKPELEGAIDEGLAGNEARA